MSTALQRVESTAIEAPGVNYSASQLQLIKDTYAKGASDEEFRLFVEIAKHRKLDILKGHMCLIKFRDKALGRDVFQPVVKIDGYRSKAEETGKYEGQTLTEWCGKDGIWRDAWLEELPPAAARVGIYRTGFREPLYVVARFSSYAQRWPDGNLKGQWGTMPDVMIAKCAESLALRKTFPEILGGLYTEDEMDQAVDVATEHGGSTQTHRPSPAPAPPKQQAQPNGKSTEEKAIDEALMAQCVKDKGEKNAPAFFKARFGDKTIEQKRALLAVRAPVAQQQPINRQPEVIEGEIVEEKPAEPLPSPARLDIDNLCEELHKLGCPYEQILAKIAKIAGGVYVTNEIEEADLPKVKMMLKGYVEMGVWAADEMAKEFKPKEGK